MATMEESSAVTLDLNGLLLAYDDQLRTDAETRGALSVQHVGPLWLATFPGGHGFVTYRNLDGVNSSECRTLVKQALDHFRNQPTITEVEWKTRGHDRTSGLSEALVGNGFVPDEPESIMLGDARCLAAELPLPDGVTLRRIESERDIRAMSAMTDVAFGDPVSEQQADRILRRLARNADMEAWVAEADGTMVSAGRLEPVPNSDVAGIWGGATLEAWRGRGIYRALTAARARSALRLGKTLIHSDSTEFSRPILERSGLVKVSTTTPYRWKRPAIHLPEGFRHKERRQ